MMVEDDVAAKLHAEARKSGKSFKVVVNESIRLGLLSKRTTGPRGRFVVKPFAVKKKTGINYDNVWQLVEDLEGPAYK
ncbi:MAG: hypothetical protein ABI165_10240 [Bryobacteraceae bacterium]